MECEETGQRRLAQADAAVSETALELLGKITGAAPQPSPLVLLPAQLSVPGRAAAAGMHSRAALRPPYHTRCGDHSARSEGQRAGRRTRFFAPPPPFFPRIGAASPSFRSSSPPLPRPRVPAPCMPTCGRRRLCQMTEGRRVESIWQERFVIGQLTCNGTALPSPSLPSPAPKPLKPIWSSIRDATPLV